MPLNIPFSEGLNTATDSRGEGLKRATGIQYLPGDQNAHKIGGVTEFADTGSAAKIDGVALLQFDSGGTDKLVALSDKTLYGANVTDTGATGTFSTLKASLGDLATSLSAAHFNDKHYIALGSENLVLKSDGTTYEMGMRPPQGTIKGTPGQGTILIRPDAHSGGFSDMADAYDDGTDATDTYAHTTLSAEATTSMTLQWTATANSGSGRVIAVKYALSGFPVLPDFPSDGDFDDVGGTFDSGYLVTVKMEYSIDNGSNYTTFFNRKLSQGTGASYAQVDLADSQEIQNLLLVRVSMQYRQGNTNAGLFIYDANVNDGGTAADFTTTTGLYYGVAEYDEDEDEEGPAIYSALVTIGASKNNVSLSLPTTASNSRATHWIIYRTTDGGGIPQALRKLDQKPIAATTYLDTFTTDKDTPAKALYPLLRTTKQSDPQALAPLYFPLNSAPPRLSVIRTYEGSLVGLSSDPIYLRSFFYSVAGRPNSWAEINVIESFPFPEHDELVNGIALGSSFLLAAKGLMMRLSSLPRVVNSVRDTSRVDQLQGAPGCVGRYALTAFSVAGEPRAAWISPYGIYMTNGDYSWRISDGIKWGDFDGLDKSSWVLHWDANRLCLVFSVTSNDEYYLLHMAPEHALDRQQPKWTGAHPGLYHAFSSGQVASTHRVYAGHSSDGSVYVVDRRGTGTDASQAHSGTILPMIVQTRRFYAEDRSWAAIDARLWHTDFGAGETCTLDWTVDNDDEVGGDITVPMEPISLAGEKGTQFDVSTQCQWAQATVTHTGSAAKGAALRDLVVQTRARGRSGGKRIA